MRTFYYYDQLNKEQQRAYYAMKEGLLNLKDSSAVELTPQYLFSKNKIKEHRQAMGGTGEKGVFP